MNPTNYIFEKGGLTKFPELTDSRYSMANSGGVEVEVGEFLYGLVKMIKPVYILETGTHFGISASYMGLAMKENALSGRLDTIEYNEENWRKSQDLFNKLELQNYIYGYKSLIESFNPQNEYDLLFLDSEPILRWRELERFYPFLKPGGYAFIHDLPHTFCTNAINPDHPDFINWPFSTIPDKIKELMRNKELIPFHFRTPRDMAGFYKSAKEDYDTNQP